jgi:hypothetical protein
VLDAPLEVVRRLALDAVEVSRAEIVLSVCPVFGKCLRGVDRQRLLEVLDGLLGV